MILISEVEIIWMLMPSSARVRNICAAMPACERMPMPTIDTLAIRSSPDTSRHLMCGCTWPLRIFIAFAESLRCTVNDRSVMPSWPTFCTMTSTSMLASAIGPRMA